MENYLLHPIGTIQSDGEEGAKIVLLPQYASALAGLEGFTHLNLLWWFSESDDAASRATLQEEAPYQNGPQHLGVFATRSPQRPNPIALSCVAVTYLDEANATIGIAYTDAHPGTPVLDIKPYTPSLDRVEKPGVPDWCAQWPGCLEESGDFDWGSVFNF